MRINAYAKLNIALNVIGKRPDGYHLLESFMLPLRLHDVIIIKKGKKQFISNTQIEDNSINRAAEVFETHFNVRNSYRIRLNKRIPIGAGLAGGSADASAILRALCKINKIKATTKELESLALKLGADTVFCLYNKAAYVTGIGETLTFLEAIKSRKVYLMYPNIEVSTAKVFREFEGNDEHIDINKTIEMYKYEDNRVYENMKNELMGTTLKTYPELEKIYDCIRAKGIKIFMSGSGSTFFTFEKLSKEQKRFIKKLGITLIETKTKNHA